MKMKRMSALILTTILLLCALTGCGGDDREVNIGTSAPPGTINGASDGGPSGSDPAPGTGTLSLEQALKSGQAQQNNRLVLMDTQLGIEACRAYAPSGWSQVGRVDWSGGIWGNPAVIYFMAETQDGTSAGVVSNINFTDPSSGSMQGGYNATTVRLGPYMNVEQYATHFLKSAFPGASNIQVTDIVRPTAEQQTALTQLEKMARQNTYDAVTQTTAYQMGYMQIVDVQAQAESAKYTFSFTANDETYCGCVSPLIIKSSSTVNNASGTSTDVSWSIPLNFFYFAKASMYDARLAEAKEIHASFILNSQWQQSINDSVKTCFQNDQLRQLREWQQVQQYIAQQAAAYAAQSQANYSSSGGSSSSGTSVMDGWTNAITGNSYYEAPDGGSVLLDYNQHHYTDGSSIYSSDTPLNIGGTSLSELTDLGTMGGG